ncbi:hypothetical protein [Gilvimarinus sp. DA14]|uniref:hypothetical protein n=1 Tax=Gilvimarinus sp. DA14 TaxID=2956798 RepID=UPI0020B870A8|nr:hypothetical protein [Gilvimarinus sp. DA14]UTF59278.1 hypothetical protein NHM04_12420 [Gilvimarinus sp. DA14]
MNKVDRKCLDKNWKEVIELLNKCRAILGKDNVTTSILTATAYFQLLDWESASKYISCAKNICENSNRLNKDEKKYLITYLKGMELTITSRGDESVVYDGLDYSYNEDNIDSTFKTRFFFKKFKEPAADSNYNQ